MKKMNIPFSPPDIGEEEIKEVIEVLKSGWITTGPKTKQFETEIANYCHTEKVVCLNSQTACAELTLRILGIGPGDEVIVPAYTYTASASVINHVGAKIVMIDSQKDHYEMDYDLLEAAITEKTKAIIPVDIGGMLCDYDRIYEIIEKKKALFQPSNKIQKAFNRIIVVADGAHSFGAEKDGKRSGEFGDFTNFSFHAVKNLTTAEGGAVTWRTHDGIDNEDLYKQYQLLSLHGQSKDALAKNQLGAWEYDVVGPYYKCNMTDIMAGIGLVQLRRYPEILKRRREIIERYDKAFKDLNIEVLDHRNSSCHLYMVRLIGKNIEQRNALIKDLAEKGIATNVHYKPLPMHTAYKKLGFDIMHFSNTYQLYKNEITLPLHTCLSDVEIEYIINMFIEGL